MVAVLDGGLRRGGLSAGPTGWTGPAGPAGPVQRDAGTLGAVPELPEVEALAAFLGERAVGHVVARVDTPAFTALKTFDPPVSALLGLEVAGASRPASAPAPATPESLPATPASLPGPLEVERFRGRQERLLGLG